MAAFSWDSLTLMFQREPVAERIVGKTGVQAYGRLALMVAWRGQRPRSCCSLPPEGVHAARPKVSSAVVHITPAGDAALSGGCKGSGARRVAMASNQRRKMLRADIKGLHPRVRRCCAAQGIAPTARAEEIGLEQFCALARGAERRLTQAEWPGKGHIYKGQAWHKHIYRSTLAR